MKVGVLAVQGAVSEHVEALHAAARNMGRAVDVVQVRTTRDLAACQGLIIPGGESTTISRLLRSTGLHDAIVARVGKGSADDLAIMGTCAGLILLASDADHDVEEKDIHLLGLLDARVDRNAFGRQRESCEASVDVAGIGVVPGVFIRAPALDEVWGETTELARRGDRIVAAAKGKVLGVAFHPELSGDTRVHEYFLDLVATAL